MSVELKLSTAQTQAILSGKVHCFADTRDLGDEADVTIDGVAFMVSGKQKMELGELMAMHWQDLGFDSRMEAMYNWEATRPERTWFGIEFVYLYHILRKEKV